MSTSLRVGIAGVTGYTGAELLRLVDAHPRLEVTWTAAGRSAGGRVIDSWPGLTGLVDLPVEALEVDAIIARCDVVFLALPHGIAAEIAPALVDGGVQVIDLGADFRLRDPAVYRRYYGLEHASPAWLERAVYGLVELNREALRGARLIANPGCYPTAVGLAAAPLVQAGLHDGWLAADCLSGVSGAGRSPGPRSMFCEVGESARPYGVGGTHRHVPEIEQTLGVAVTFTPHLVPMSRGMLATVHARPKRAVSLAEARELFAARYADEPLVVLRSDEPSTGDVRGTSRAHVHVTVDSERQVITAICAIDNLLKGASGQAIQALNASMGWPESLGLPRFPVLP